MFPARRPRSARPSLRLLACLGVLAPAAASGLEAGTPAPNFTAPALDGGGQVSLAAHRGKVVYLDFWASWCAPCLTALPAVDGLRREFDAGDFQVVAVNVDRDPGKARRLLEQLGVGYPSATDPDGRIPERYEIETMPTSFLIDRDGVIRHVHDGFRRGDVAPLRARISELVAAGR